MPDILQRVACLFSPVAVALASALSAQTVPADSPSNNSPSLSEPQAPASVNPTLALTAEYWSNRHGGVREGSRWNTLLDAGVELNLSQIAKSSSGELFAQFLWVRNQNAHDDMAALTGAFNPVSGNQAHDFTRVSNLYYKRSWDSGIFFKAGQLVLNNDFMLSDNAGTFCNSAFGTMPAIAATPLAASLGNHPAFATFPVAAPGVFLRYEANPCRTWQFGIYHGGPGPDESHNHGFDWDSLSKAGVVAVAETTWKAKYFFGDSTLRLGTDYHSGTFDDFAALNRAASDATVRGLISAYVSHDLTLASSAEGKPDLGFFWQMGACPFQDRAVVTTFADVGINWFGPIEARPDDVAGVGFAWTRFGNGYRQYRGAALLAPSENATEVFYHLNFATHWFVKIDLQVLRNPADPSERGNHRTATVAGLVSGFRF